MANFIKNFYVSKVYNKLGMRLGFLNDKRDISALNFFRRKMPKAYKYPYEVHYPEALENIPEGLEAFYLVGRNWHKRPDLPIAIAFGMNAWKYGFIADYCPDMRVAFARRHFWGPQARLALGKLRNHINAIYVWGYTDHASLWRWFLPRRWISAFSKRHNIPLFRVEDGFLRSAGLGAKHFTPYSLVFDSRGLHYNSENSNDLDHILRTFDFSSAEDLLAESENVLKDINKYNLSKYNLPDFSTGTNKLRIKSRKRILVIGQVDKDAAVRMGNPKGWKMLEILRAAKLENPDAEILYRPHPEVYAGIQKSRFRLSRSEAFAEIVSPEQPLVDLLETVDHLYVLSSLSGFEALIRGLKVTTFGAPFYAGWGLTEDRSIAPKGRNLMLSELIVGAYFLYPRYLANTKDPIDGYRVTVQKILADRDLLALLDENHSGELSKSELQKIANTDQWPRLLTIDYSDINQSISSLILNKQAPRWLQNCRSDLAQSVCLHLLLGWAKDPSTQAQFLGRIIDIVSVPVLNEVILALFQTRQQNVSDWTFLAALAKKADPTDSVAPFLSQLSLIGVEPEKEADEKLNDAKNLKARFDFLMLDVNYDDAIVAAKKLLLHSGPNFEIIEKLSDLAIIKFDYKAAERLANLLKQSGSLAAIKKASAVELMALPEIASESEAKTAASRYLILNPGKVVNVQQALKKAFVGNPDLDNIIQSVLDTLRLHTKLNVAKVQSLIALEQPEAALEAASYLARTGNYFPQLAVVYSQALSANGKIAEARWIVAQTLKDHPISLVYREALRLTILDNDYDSGLTLYKEALSRKIDVGDMLPRKILFGSRKVHAAMLTFKKFHLRHQAMLHYPDKYCDEPVKADPNRTLFATAIFGPGDELRFAEMYNRLSKVLPHKQISIGCDPRICTLFERSFPKLDFVPVKRIRNFDPVDPSEYSKVKSSHLTGALCNVAAEMIEQHDDFILVSDLLSDVYKGYESFLGKPYLMPDPEKAAYYKGQLTEKVLYVGLGWRSSVLSSARNEHYFSVQELSPIFTLENIKFVNLQYDECAEELEWIEKHFPGKMINFEDLDQFNDFEGVAALMSALDIVICPTITPVELSGALGIETWLLSSSFEVGWRKMGESFVDVWHNSTEHFEGDTPGIKQTIVDQLYRRLAERVASGG